MKFIKKIKFNIWLNIKKGYKKFIQFETLENFRFLKNDLFSVNLKKENLPKNLINLEDISKSTLQFLNQKLFDNYFFYIFLFFYNQQKKLIFPIPKEFNSIFKKNNYRVNFFLSNFLWKIFCFLQLLSGYKEILILIFLSFNLKETKKIEKNYSIFPNIDFNKLNLASTKEKNNKLFNLVRWCNDNFVDNYSVFLTKKKVTKNNFYTSYKDISDLFSYKLDTLKIIYWSTKLLFLSFKWLIFQEYWKLLILPEIVKTGYIRFSKQNPPKYIYFIWTNNHYRPLWTYEFNLDNICKMIFVGSLNGLILKGAAKLTKNDFEGLSVATWPNYYAWHSEHEKYIKERVKNLPTIITLNKQTYFKDKEGSIEIPGNSISVFGYENNKFILGYSTLADYDTQNKFLLEKFYENIYDILKANNLLLVLKRKKKLGNIEIKKFRKFFEDFKKRNSVIFVDEDYSVEKIIKSTKATISMPFTSTGFIAYKMGKPSVFYDPCNWIDLKDPSALGLNVFNNKENLNKWIKKDVKKNNL